MKQGEKGGVLAARKIKKNVSEQKDILFSEGYKDFAPSDDGGKFIVKYPAADKVKVQQLLNNNAIKL